jgi:late competence protein required for DNA uptake (superfamily II DNA/RNA helicase)
MKCPKCNTTLQLSVDAKMGERYYCWICKEFTRVKLSDDIGAGIG